MSISAVAPLATCLFDAFNQRDLSAWASHVAPDAQFSYPGFRARGVEAARAYNAPFLAAFSDLHFQVHYVLVDGDRSVAKVTGRGTHDGPLVTEMGTIPPTGRTIEVDALIAVTTHDGRIVQEETYWDRADMMAQLGLSA